VRLAASGIAATGVVSATGQAIGFPSVVMITIAVMAVAAMVASVLVWVAEDGARTDNIVLMMHAAKSTPAPPQDRSSRLRQHGGVRGVPPLDYDHARIEPVEPPNTRAGG
jgi:hypothetical protein